MVEKYGYPETGRVLEAGGRGEARMYLDLLRGLIVSWRELVRARAVAEGHVHTPDELFRLGIVGTAITNPPETTSRLTGAAPEAAS